jgi:hypothetical protein
MTMSAISRVHILGFVGWFEVGECAEEFVLMERSGGRPWSKVGGDVEKIGCCGAMMK